MMRDIELLSGKAIFAQVSNASVTDVQILESQKSWPRTMTTIFGWEP